MSTKPLSASCTCGQVVFDITSKQPGHVLTCPWCQKKYMVVNGNRIEEQKPDEPPPLPFGGEAPKHRSLIIHRRHVTTVILRKPPFEPEDAAPKPKDRKAESSIGLKRLKPSAITSSKAELLKQAAEKAADASTAKKDAKLETKRGKTETKRAKTETKSAKTESKSAKTETKRGTTETKTGKAKFDSKRNRT
ncbi:MAG: hypothetical protein HY291_12515 [Planctomycetes bacterium]|nr:hypothetical protein [Planctomycetota bacterium]